ncbi:HD-domain/PDEase-like protein, partial [Pholiota conissans]
MCPGGGLSPHQPTGLAQAPAVPHDWRRRSADIGGLHLATTTPGQGQGWMGGEPAAVETRFAELLSDMYNQTNSSVNDNSVDAPPPELPSSVRSRLIHSLDRWHFEPHLLPDEELIECTLILFEVLFRVEGMQEAIPISMKQISSFIHHLRRIYRYENSYHNFEHALDVLQATQSYLKSAGMVPSPLILFQPYTTWKPAKSFDSGSLIGCLGLRELFILYVSAIGHDVGHPGFSNIFMKNARTPLSLVFNDTSALENLHCLLLLQVMKHHGLGALLDDPAHGQHLRKILQKTVLATDMGVHQDFMERMQRMLDGERTSLCHRQVIICQAILKNADISNPTRPFLVSKHWANALMQEWTAQAQFEEELQLAPTVASSTSYDPIKEANGQIFFISTFAKPLLVLTEKAIPEMRMYTTHCKQNLSTWKKRLPELTRERELAPSSSSSSNSKAPSAASSSDAYITAFPLSLPTIKIAPESMSAYAPSWSGRSEAESSPPGSPTES